MSEQAIEALQMRLAYLDDAFDQLSDTVYAQSRTIERLEKRCEQLEARVTALAEGREDGADAHEPPPHY